MISYILGIGIVAFIIVFSLGAVLVNIFDKKKQECK